MPSADQGKLIMACGTGKTFTALKIAERETPENGFVLFLVPSIAPLSQTLREWTAEFTKVRWFDDVVPRIKRVDFLRILIISNYQLKIFLDIFSAISVRYLNKLLIGCE